MVLAKQYPPETIETDRLVLKRKTVDMATELFLAIDANRVHLKTFLGWVDKTQSVSDVQKTALKTADEWNNYNNFVYLLFDKDSNTVLGSIDLQKIDWDNYCSHIGYWMACSHQGRGLMAEAVMALSSVAYDMGFNRLEIRCRGDNTRSQSVAKRCGFMQEGLLRQVSHVCDQFYDEMIFSRLRTDN